MLTLVPTPIGNLKDITFRALEAILRADVILCEDTRVTKKLFNLLKDRFCVFLDSKILESARILESNLDSKEFYFFLDSALWQKQRQFISFHSHNSQDFLINSSPEFFAQNNVIYVSDAGMPSICDPGALLVQYAMAHNIAYDVLPGCCALVTAFGFSGVESQGFIFGGFLPHKQEERRQKLKTLLDSSLPLIVYESPHRILQTLSDLDSSFSECAVFAIKEMTKLHQKSFFGAPKEILKSLADSNAQGEWTLIIKAHTESKLTFSYEEILDLPLPLKLKSKMLSKLSNKDAKAIYKELSQNLSETK